ncbi:prevent-host-death family protein, partial [Vibrio vulnificus]
MKACYAQSDRIVSLCYFFGAAQMKVELVTSLKRQATKI